ncbi:MAG: ribonuclease J [Desulfobacterales bacterium]|jgi:ribonuclease J
MIKMVPLGGLGEIGLNMMAFEDRNTLFIVDAGLMFPEGYMLGIDFVIPDMEYIRQNASRVAAVILTHAHEDHVGALPFVLRIANVPVFGTPFTLGVVRNRLDEFGQLQTARLHEINPGERIKLGAFEIEFIRVRHSVVDGVGLAIQTPFGRIVHTGDFKISHDNSDGMATDVNRFAEFGAKGVLALLSDSTNVEKEGYTISAQEIGRTIAHITENSKGRIIIALFASNVTRIQQIVNIAKARGKKIVFNGRSIEVTVTLAKKLGHLDIPREIEIDVDDIGYYPDDEIIMVTTGSQGEPMSVLARMASGTHRHIKIRKEDTIVLSSKFIPGNEKAITAIINRLYRLGADVIYEKISAIHVSGHAFQEELKLMINLVKPKVFIPIHGEYRHLLLHTRLAKKIGMAEDNVLLAENGQVVEFDSSGARIRDRVPTGRVLVDGKGIGDVGQSVLRERRMLSEHGLVVVSLVLDEETGTVVHGPEVYSRGFVFETETGHLLDDAICVVLEVVEDIGPDAQKRVEKIRARLQTVLKQYFFFTIGRRPYIIPIVVEV